MARLLPVATIALLAGACATTGGTFNSGVGDRVLTHPPYYAGPPVVRGTATVGHFPVGYQQGARQPAMFEPSGAAGSPVATLLAEMNTYLDSLGVTTRIGTAPQGIPPDVQFGCATDAVGDCETGTHEPGGFLQADQPTFRLAVGRPSREWIAAAQGAMADAGVERALVLTLEMADYWPRQKNLRGSKEVELGTGHVMPLPWLTSLDTPVSVVQLTGALMGPDGRAVRIGAEGMLARRTSLLVSSLGAQALITDEDVERLRTMRRDDLPGRPLAWQVALRHLVAELTGRAEVAVR